MTTTLQRLDVVQVFTDIDGTGKTWNDYCTIKEQGDEGRALELVTGDPQRYRVFGRRIVDGSPVYACVYGQAEVAAEAIKQVQAHAAKISELLGEFEDLARAKGLDLHDVVTQYNEEYRIACVEADALDEAERRYFSGIDMSNLP
jgi:hypothetical protein